jgi:hypothetical protein
MLHHLWVVLVVVSTGCNTFRTAYKVDPVVVDKRFAANAFGACFFAPVTQLTRLLVGNPQIDPIWLDRYMFPEDDTGQSDDRWWSQCRAPKIDTTISRTVAAPSEPVLRTTDPAANALPALGVDEPPTVASLCQNTKFLAYDKAQECREDRNRLIDKIVARSNDMCVQHMSGYVSQQALNELILGSSTLGLTAAASVVGGTTLAAAATAVSGLRSLISEAVYYEQLAPVLLARALAERDAIYAQITANREIFSLDASEDPAPCKTSAKLIGVMQKLYDDQLLVVSQHEADLAKEKDEAKKLKLTKQIEDGKALLARHEANLGEARSRSFVCRPWNEYTMDSAITDLQAFHDSCSFYRALGFSETDIRDKSSAIQKNIQAIYDDALKRAAAGNTKAQGSKPVVGTGVTPPSTTTITP